MAYCNQCGNLLAEGVKFCPKCGAAVALPATPAPAPTAPSQPQETAQSVPPEPSATPEPLATPGTSATPAPAAPEPAQPHAASPMYAAFEKSFTEAMDNAVDSTAEFDPKDIEANKIMALFSYLSILVLIPIFAARESKFARFHANQGLLLCLVAFVYTVAVNMVSGVLGAISWRLGSFCSLLNLATLAFFAMAVMGILNALNGKAKELPFIGRYKLLK